jgi:hypothetical protein
MDVALGANETMRCWVIGFCVLTEASLADWGAESIQPACEKIPGPKEKTIVNLLFVVDVHGTRIVP